MRSFITYASLFFTTVLLYQTCWDNPFVLDDLTKIYQNTDLQVPFRLENFIYPYANNKMYFRNDPSRPLTYMLYWVAWHVGDGNPKAFHIINTIGHALCSVLLALLTALLVQKNLESIFTVAGFVCRSTVCQQPDYRRHRSLQLWFK